MMPKVRPLTKDPFEEEKRKLSAWIAGNKKLVGINSNKELAVMTGIPESTIAKRIRQPETMTKLEEWKLLRVLGEMGR